MADHSYPSPPPEHQQAPPPPPPPAPAPHQQQHHYQPQHQHQSLHQPGPSTHPYHTTYQPYYAPHHYYTSSYYDSYAHQQFLNMMYPPPPSHPLPLPAATYALPPQPSTLQTTFAANNDLREELKECQQRRRALKRELDMEKNVLQAAMKGRLLEVSFWRGETKRLESELARAKRELGMYKGKGSLEGLRY